MEKPNLDYIKTLADGDTDFEKKLIGIIKREFPEECEVFYDNFNNKNYTKTAENVHKLKHKINLFGLNEGYEVAVAFEDQLREEKSSLFNDFKEILNTLEKYINQL